MGAIRNVRPMTSLFHFYALTDSRQALYRAGSKIFHGGGGVDPFWGGFGLQRGHFSVKMYAKTKELGPVGGVRWHAP